jgi:hypothetical protein
MWGGGDGGGVGAVNSEWREGCEMHMKRTYTHTLYAFHTHVSETTYEP